MSVISNKNKTSDQRGVAEYANIENLKHPLCSTILSHPLTFTHSLMILGYEPLPATLTHGVLKIFGSSGKHKIYPNVLRYFWKLKTDHGFITICITGLSASVFHCIVEDYTTQTALQRLFPNKIPANVFCDIDHSVNECVKDTLNIMRARILGIVLAYPFKVIMLRQIAEVVSGGESYSNVPKAILNMLVNEGPLSLYDGIVPRIIAEVITIASISLFAYCTNKYLLPDKFRRKVSPHMPKLATHAAPLLMSFIVTPFNVVSTNMAISGADLALSCPYRSWMSCYNYLKIHNSLKRGSAFFFRYAIDGPY